MFIGHLIIAIVIAVILAFVLSALLEWRHPRNPESTTGAAMLFLFFFLLFPILAIGAWMIPAGPMIYGTPWIGPIIVGLLLALMILAIAPEKRRDTPLREEEVDEAMRQQAAEETAPAVVTAFFWFFVVLALALLIAAYV